MKLTKKQELEARKVYAKYWDSYMKGDLKGFSSTLDEALEMIGTSESEVCHSKADGIKFYKAQMKEIVGKAEMRNRRISVKPVNGMFLFNETADIYILDKRKWTFYAGIRISTLIHETRSGWKVIQQHGSFPDMRVEEGETIAFEKISKENLELRDAVKRATVELEAKNRNLETEAALERVRAVAMGMKKQEDMLVICKTIAQQLQKLGVKEIRNVQTAIIYPQKGSYLNYEYYAKHDKLLATEVLYIDHPMTKAFIKKMLDGPNEFFKRNLTQKQTMEWYAFQKKSTKQFADKFLLKASSLSYYWYSLGPVALGISTYTPLCKEDQELFVRFRNVFELSYRRFKDIEKAEAQAREAQIETALEKVRSRTMAMHKSEELKDVIKVVLQQFIHLNINVGHAGFYIDYKAYDDMHIWLADPNIEPFFAILPYFDTPTWNSFLDAKAKGTTLHTDLLDFKTKNKFYKSLFKLFTVPEEAKKFYLQCKGLAVSTVLLDTVGLYIENFEGIPYTDEENNILIRFGKVFQQTYTRFLDLQKAEAQARESQIQLALERVRARTMAMQKSVELGDVTSILFKQVNELGIKVLSTGFNIWDKDEDSITCWMANPSGGFLPPYKVPINDFWLPKELNSARQRNEEFLELRMSREQLRENFEYMSKLSEFKTILKSIDIGKIDIPETQVDNYAFFSQGSILFITNEPCPASHDIFKRFAKVFEQTYTRFLDLQKAEAQAREAKIEAALEKVRSRTMAMQKSSELADVATVLFKELNQLVLNLWTCGFVLCEKDRVEDEWWLCAEGGFIPAFYLPNIGDATHYNIYQGWLNDETYHTEQLEGEALEQHYEWLMNIPVGKKIFEDMSAAGFERPVWQKLHCAYFSKGYLCIITREPCPEEEVFKRFAQVFDLTYTRFLDLQKAEAQAREAQIEAALERVRSRSMAMHKSEELADLSLELVKQVQALGVKTWFCAFNIYDDDLRGSLEWGSNGEGTFPRYRTPREGVFLRYYEAGQRGETLLINEIGEDECPAHYEYLCSLPGVGEQLLKMKAAGIPFPASQIDHVAFFKYGYLLFISYEPVPESHDIFKRFAKVFEQTYTRFLDLQKAEELAREAQIELALERVRAKAMSMQHSGHLKDVIEVIGQQLQEMGLFFDYVNFIVGDTADGFDTWNVSFGQANPVRFFIPRIDNRVFNEVMQARKNGLEFIAYTLPQEETFQFVTHLITMGILKYLPEEALQKRLQSKGMSISTAVLNEVFLTIANYSAIPYTDEENSILKRFGNAFQQAFTRFLDLQKAEELAREAQIEAALERVRSRTMGMQKSTELNEVAFVLFEQIRLLGGNLWGTGFGLCDTKDGEDAFWFANEMGVMPPVTIPHTDDDVHIAMYKAWKNKEEYYQSEKGGEELKAHYRYLNTLPPVKDFFQPMLEAGFHFPEWQQWHASFFSKGYLLIITQEPYPDPEIFKRFAKVFDQTYTRFLDLQKAEAQAREALIEVALERVRARALAMQEPEELKDVAQVMRNEMGALGVEELETSSIYIHGDSSENVECWYALQDPKHTERKMIADHFMLDLSATWVGREMKKFYLSGGKQTSVVMQGNNRREWIEYCYKHSPVFSGFYGETIPDRTYHLYKFSHGYIGAAAPGDISAESWGLLSRAASVFSLAYSRFKDLSQAKIDLQRLKEEKQRAETALSELQTTQKQLVQSEKMASLGELTAGIAHEIQNPLNFVNNFSEVSKELLDEMKEAIEKGDTGEAKEIIDDVIQNLEKINHHGKRADGIVKGMLQHSRSGTGQKELTDINALCDEYLRLAFHGLRAKDKSFNAKFETSLDETVGKINVMPQDMGRVVLNLINNAFYAVNERKRNGETNYEPTVIVTTRKEGEKVLISVKDNGTGIPQKVVDKIFQPFFTTKPTGQGTGLGLSLSYDIVKAHGGELKVQTKEGEGSEFIIELPV